jgi:hypothetical protein
MGGAGGCVLQRSAPEAAISARSSAHELPARLGSERRLDQALSASRYGAH